jgi:hypothetical protein
MTMQKQITRIQMEMVERLRDPVSATLARLRSVEGDPIPLSDDEARTLAGWLRSRLNEPRAIDDGTDLQRASDLVTELNAK